MLLPPRSAPSGCSTGDRSPDASSHPSRHFLLIECYGGSRARPRLWRARARSRSLEGVVSEMCLSAIHFRGRSIRQVSCYTLLGGCRLPWPPSCCLDESTPFLASACAHGVLGSLTTLRLVHPPSPFLLTRSGPLESCSVLRGTCVPLAQHSAKIDAPSLAPVPSLRISRAAEWRPEPSNHSLYQMQPFPRLSNPEGNFGRNQLQDGSVSLSPLYPGLTNDLHVSNATNFHQSFL